ncbi:MAG: hypothetical protein ACI8YQ_003608 [Polaribacter sp.]|jgi:hypothetical protein
MSHHQTNINRPVSSQQETLPRTATFFGRLISLLHGGKEIYTTGLEMTTVVPGGNVSCLL